MAAGMSLSGYGLQTPLPSRPAGKGGGGHSFHRGGSEGGAGHAAQGGCGESHYHVLGRGHVPPCFLQVGGSGGAVDRRTSPCPTSPSLFLPHQTPAQWTLPPSLLCECTPQRPVWDPGQRRLLVCWPIWTGTTVS